MKISFSTLLGNLDEHLRQQLKEYQFRKDAPPSEPVNPPVKKRVKKPALPNVKTDRTLVKADVTEPDQKVVK